MKKTWLKALEHVFSAEIEGHSYQSSAKVYDELQAAGLVEWNEQKMSFNDGLPPMIVGGWILTHPGRIAYCESCKGEH